VICHKSVRFPCQVDIEQHRSLINTTNDGTFFY
jgi:hypothetical protein